jgi:hypothetical protein
MKLAMKLLAIIFIWIMAWTPAAVVAFLQGPILQNSDSAEIFLTNMLSYVMG